MGRPTLASLQNWHRAYQFPRDFQAAVRSALSAIGDEVWRSPSDPRVSCKSGSQGLRNRCDLAGRVKSQLEAVPMPSTSD
jgi:hypothetical protein